MTTGTIGAEQRKNTLVAVLLTCVGYAYFNIGDAAVKMLGERLHYSEVVGLSCLISAAFMALYGGYTEGRGAFIIHQHKLVLFRAILGVVLSFLNVMALPHVPLTTFYALIFTSPLWVALLSALFLGEKIERGRLGAILAGFAVILFVFQPGSGTFSVWAALPLISAFIYAGAMVVMRRMGPRESRTMIIITANVLCGVIALPIMFAHYVPPTPYEWGLFLILGMLGAIGMTCVSYAFQNAPSAAVIAPYHYTQIIWGALIGYFIFDEVPDTRTLIGAAGIIAVGLYLIYGETRRPLLRSSGV